MMGDNPLTGPALRHALARAGFEPVGSYKQRYSCGEGRRNVTIYASVNAAHWKAADIAAKRQHIEQMSLKDKELWMECADLL